MPKVLSRAREEIVHNAVSNGWLHRFRHGQRTDAGERLAMRIRRFQRDLRQAATGQGQGQDALAGQLLPFALHFGMVEREQLTLLRFAHAWVAASVGHSRLAPSKIPPDPASMSPMQSQSPPSTSRSWTGTSAWESGSRAGAPERPEACYVRRMTSSVMRMGSIPTTRMPSRSAGSSRGCGIGCDRRGRMWLVSRAAEGLRWVGGVDFPELVGDCHLVRRPALAGMVGPPARSPAQGLAV